MPATTWDPRCYDLAEVFLQDDPPLPAAAHEARASHLAGTIQQAIEDWLEDHPAEGRE
jgi:hypothetical protein